MLDASDQPTVTRNRQGGGSRAEHGTRGRNREDRPVDCPLCGHSGDRTEVYRHLQVEHRKSEVCELLVAEQG